ncbi:site-specific integrase [Streptomyces jumonjinensis]|uniref:Tyr recombinase domain-containing protein n=1 Tax=Streptomyces jumonjinensis TaxID=1945 RepID=A0A646KTK2_STRJU|nr:hypothetical protein [Streptomyces jumonjinensis]MQT05438.1 hypothetical protein [Streptomyces jumonjinensis]
MDTSHLVVTDAEVDSALADPSVPLAVRAVWRALWEAEVRPLEAVALDVPGVELENCLIVLHDTKEGGSFEVDITDDLCRLLRDLIGARRTGPVFMHADRRLSVEDVASEFRRVTGKDVHGLRFTRQKRRTRLLAQFSSDTGSTGS